MINKITIIFIISIMAGTFSIVMAEDKLLNLGNLSLKLEKKQSTLNERENKLDERENSLNFLKNDLDSKQDELDILRKKLDEKLQKIRIIEDENLEKLAKIYASTKAKSAAEIIAKMDIDKAVSLFQRIPPRAAGKILTSLGKVDAAFASEISERLTPDKNVIE